MKRTNLALVLTVILLTGALSGCGSKAVSSDAGQQTAAASSEAAQQSEFTEPSTVPAAEASSSSGTDSTDLTVIKGIADLVPHSEIIEFVEPQLEAQGYKVELVATASDETTNEKLANGEIDFDYFQHWPYLKAWNETNGYDLVDAGDIHIEPITAYSDKYVSTDEIPENAVVAIPNDGTNEYRALRILEQNGFIKLDSSTADSLSATTSDITEYTKPIKIVEIDSAQIIPTKDDYDFFITNTNKALEAKITSNKLFSEGSDSPYANIIATRPEDKDNPAIVALVKALQSDETKKFIEEKYNGAVIPAGTAK